MFHFILQCIWLMLPIGAANMSPVIFRHQLNVLAKPIDSGRSFAGFPLFGEHKTWRGLIVGTLSGGAVFILQQALYTISSFEYMSLIDYPDIPSYLGFIMGFGALFGDLIRAFFKRRFGILPGKSWVPFDQIDYVIGGLAFTMFFIHLNVNVILTTILLGFILHIIVSHIGYYLKMKDTRW